MKVLVSAAISLAVFVNIAASLCAQTLFLRQPVIITAPNGSINLPVGTPMRLVSYNGDTFRVTADGITMIDLDRSVMTTEQEQQSQKTDNVNDTSRSGDSRGVRNKMSL